MSDGTPTFIANVVEKLATGYPALKPVSQGHYRANKDSLRLFSITYSVTRVL
jgi:hypothetical protein